MGKCKFVRVYLRRTQEKLERVLDTEHQSSQIWVILNDVEGLNTYERVEIDSKTGWNVERIARIRRRNASRRRSKFRFHEWMVYAEKRGWKDTKEHN